MILESLELRGLGTEITYGIITAILLAFQSYMNKRRGNQAQAKLDHISQQVNEAKKELTPDGGESIKDIVGIIHKKIDIHSEKIDRCFKGVEGCVDRIDQLSIQMKTLMITDRSKLEWMLNQSDDAMYLANANGDIDFVNKAMERLFEANPPHILNKKRFNFISTSSQKSEAIKSLILAIESKTDFSMQYTIFQRSSKTTVDVYDSTECITDAASNFMHFIGKIKPIQNA